MVTCLCICSDQTPSTVLDSAAPLTQAGNQSVPAQRGFNPGNVTGTFRGVQDILPSLICHKFAVKEVLQMF